jgi:DNA mismatch repair protein MutS2
MTEKTMITVPANIPDKIGFESVRKAILTYIYTPGGRALLSVMAPETDPHQVNLLQKQTSEMLALLEDGVSIPLTQLDDIDEWLDHSRTEGAVLNLEAFPAIYAHARIGRVLRDFFERSSKNNSALWQLMQKLQTAHSLEKAINRAVSDNGTLRDDASNRLKSIRNQLNNKRQTLRNEIQMLFRKAQKDGMASDEGPTLRSGRMVIPIQAEYKRKIDGFVHDISSSGQTVYIEPVQALHINNDIRSLEAEERREIERILQELTTEVRKHLSVLKSNNRLISHIDLIHARTRLGKSWEGVIPEYSDSQQWNIIRGRNPNLILKNRHLPKDSQEEVVPLDLQLNGDEQGIIISGPNAGGKSVALKTTGLMSMMYQCGIPLPVQADSTLPVISGLFLDMGDEQSIEQDLSTFSSRLKWMKQTLDQLDYRSLVLIDEAGTGTDPEEGGALFQAFIEMVLNNKAVIIATTHHGALKVFAHDHPLLANGAMEFNQETLAPTYRFRKGNPGSSYAFEIAERMELPDKLLHRSRALLGDQRDRMADLLLSLEQRLQEAEQSQNRYEILRKKAEEQEKTYREKAADFEQVRKEKLEEAYREADRIMKDANRRIEQAVEKITMEGKKSRENVRKVRREVEDHKKKIRHKLQDTEPRNQDIHQDQPLEIGDRVSISGSDTVGELIEVDDNKAVVLAGGLKIKTNFSNLKKSKAKKPGKGKIEKWKSASYTRSLSGETVKPSLDLRGMRGDDAVKALMHYLDNVIASGLQEVDIIHGKGEGILKKLAHEYLEKRKEVKHFDLAPWERGGPGCTVVKLE